MITCFMSIMQYYTCLRSSGCQKRDASDQTKCSFSTNKELLQVVTSVILSQCRQVIQYCAIWQNLLRRKSFNLNFSDQRNGKKITTYHFQTKHIAMQVTKSHQAETTSICAHVTTQLTRSFSPKIKWYCISKWLQVIVKTFKNDTSIHYCNSRDIIEGSNLIHLGSVDNDFIEYWIGTTTHTCITTLRNNSKHFLVAVL